MNIQRGYLFVIRKIIRFMTYPPNPALTVYMTLHKSLADCRQHGATLQIDQSVWLVNSYDTRTTVKLYQHSLTLSGSDPNHREVAVGRHGSLTPSQASQTEPTTRHTHTRAALISSLGQYPAQISAVH